MESIYDPAAEQAIATCAAFSSTAAHDAASRLDAEHFHDPRCWAVIAASLTVGDTCRVGDDPWGRENAIADAANVHRATLADWCQHAPCAFDTAGLLADRVLAAHARRQRVQALLDELELLGLGVEVTV